MICGPVRALPGLLIARYAGWPRFSQFFRRRCRSVWWVARFHVPNSLVGQARLDPRRPPRLIWLCRGTGAWERVFGLTQTSCLAP